MLGNQVRRQRLGFGALVLELVEYQVLLRVMVAFGPARGVVHDVAHEVEVGDAAIAIDRKQRLQEIEELGHVLCSWCNSPIVSAMESSRSPGSIPWAPGVGALPFGVLPGRWSPAWQMVRLIVSWRPLR